MTVVVQPLMLTHAEGSFLLAANRAVEHLLPTCDALKQHVLGAMLQAM